MAEFDKLVMEAKLRGFEIAISDERLGRTLLHLRKDGKVWVMALRDEDLLESSIDAIRMAMDNFNHMT